MKILHTMIRVLDPERSLRFYRDALGLELQRRHDNAEKEYSLYFLGAPGDPSGPAIELTHNYGQKEPYERGKGYGHIAIGVESIEELGKRLKEHGVEWSWWPGSGTMAFLEDPDGYEVEILERKD